MNGDKVKSLGANVEMGAGVEQAHSVSWTEAAIELDRAEVLGTTDRKCRKLIRVVKVVMRCRAGVMASHIDIGPPDRCALRSADSRS